MTLSTTRLPLKYLTSPVPTTLDSSDEAVPSPSWDRYQSTSIVPTAKPPDGSTYSTWQFNGRVTFLEKPDQEKDGPFTTHAKAREQLAILCPFPSIDYDVAFMIAEQVNLPVSCMPV